MDKEYQIIAEHVRNKEESVKFKERRFQQWNENYSLFRDKVNTNRLTQRQPVNVPIVRETISSWISKIDEAPKLKFETRDKTVRDKSAEIMLNARYDYDYDRLKLDILDNVEKKMVGLQGRGFKKIGISKGEIFIDVVDGYDVEVDPRVNPLNLETADYVIITHIYRSLKEILADKKYSADAKKKLKVYLDSKAGIIKAAETANEYQMRQHRLENLGVTNFDEFGASDVLVELNEAYKLVWSEADNAFVRHLRVFAADNVLLLDKPLKEATGLRCLPIVTWASDPDATDFWSDGIADNVRTFNKITNMYISQDLESRTYRNFGMYFYNTLNGTFQPRAFEPKPFGMYGVPGNPDEIIKQVTIQPINDVSQQITWLKNLIQSSVAQTPTERGVKEAGEQTLGQIQLQLKGSQGMNQVVSKNYRAAWKELGKIYYELLKNNLVSPVKLFKKGPSGNYHAKDVFASELITPNGYEVIVSVESEKSAADDFDLKKLQYIKNSFMNNPAAIAIAKKKELEILDFTDDEIEAIMAMENPQQPLNMPQEAPTKENNPQDNPLQTNAASMRV